MQTTTHTDEYILDPSGDDAATENGWSDRSPATIVRRTAKKIAVQADDTFVLADDLVMFTRNSLGPERTYTLRDNGRWIQKGAPKNARGASLTLGTRDFYRDPSF